MHQPHHLVGCYACFALFKSIIPSHKSNMINIFMITIVKIFITKVYIIKDWTIKIYIIAKECNNISISPKTISPLQNTALPSFSIILLVTN